MAPFIAALVKFGLPLIAGAVQAKGKDLIQEKLGVNIEEMLGSEQGRLQLKQLELQHEQFLVDASIRIRQQEIEFHKQQEAGISDRWKADMSSDSWLSKSIRPLVLVFLLSTYATLSLLSGAAFKVDEVYIKLLELWGAIVLSAYFGGRSLEKISAIRVPK